MSAISEILHGLNQDQRCAVTSPCSVLQVLAPPGSGKTKTLTARVAYLIAQQNLRPWNIIVCTFTIKAAREMRERIKNFVGDALESKLILGTFHSVARRYLAIYGQHIGIPKNFGIADSVDSLSILKRIIKRNKYQMEPSRARSRISRLKSEGPKSATLATKFDPEKEEFDRIYAEYQDTLRASNLLDYDDLLLRCVDLLRQHPQCVSNIQAVLIDEFQDTNSVQYQLMRLFAQHRKPKSSEDLIPSITIVGDPDQSIYSFRSAEIKNLKSMRKDYPNTHVVFLQENYRSSGAILQSALEVIEQDKARPAKKLLATHCTGERPILRTLSSTKAEAAWLVNELHRILISSAGLLKYIDFAVLLRSASLSRHIESALGKAGIPYRMIGGHKFFDRIEVRILLDYLRVVAQPNHNDALLRTINMPARKIGEVTIKALLEEAETQKRSLWSLVLDIAQGRRTPACKMTSHALKSLENFVNLIITSQKKLTSGEFPLCTIFDLLAHIIKRLSFEEYLRRTHADDFETRWENVQQLILLASEASATQDTGADDMLLAIADVEQRTLDGPIEALQRFLANVALSNESETAKGGENGPDLVTLSTIHAAKGLEWPVVFIPAVYQGSIPHSRAEDTDEERRLLYVGMTRAQSLLYMSWPKKSASGEATNLSPFLSCPNMSHYFDKRGPITKFTMVQDIARILHRDCPSETAINKAKSTLEGSDDDKWSEDGDDDEQNATHYISSPNNSNTGFETFDRRPYKRPRFLHTDSGSNANFSSHTSDARTSRVTADNLNTGFISASTRFRQMKTEHCTGSNTGEKSIEDSISGGMKIVNTRYGGFMSAANCLKTFGLETGKESATTESISSTNGVPRKEGKDWKVDKGNKKRAHGQGSLLSFFSRQGA